MCVFVCVRTRMLLWVFPPCLSNRKLMWSSTEDREKAFSFHCESFQRKKKMKKRERRKKRDQASALILPSAIWPASPSFSFSLPLSLFILYTLWSISTFFRTLLFYFQFFWCWIDSSILEGNGGFIESSWVLWEDREGGRGKERRKANEAELCGEQCRFFRFTFNIPTAKRSYPHYVLRRVRKF